MKKLLAPLGLAASLFALPAFAGEIIIGVDGFNGSMNTNFTQKNDLIGFDPYAASAENFELGGGVYGGYVWNVNSGFNINFEANYDWINVTTTQSVNNIQPLTQEIKGLLGLRILPAFKITNNTELFLELGWAYVDLTFSDPNPVSVSMQEWVSGFRYGAGVQTMLFQNISLRVFYSVIDQLAETSMTHDVDGTVTATPNLNEFGIGVAYHFQL
jgi:opacity protein-like surface antigen